MNALLADYGTKQTYICKYTGIAPSDLCKFKGDRLSLTLSQCERLDKFLTERGYGNDELKAITAIIQGSFN